MSGFIFFIISFNLSKFVISIKCCSILLFILRLSNKIESFSGLSATPKTFEPKLFSQKANHAPLKPVVPVTRSFDEHFLYDYKI